VLIVLGSGLNERDKGEGKRHRDRRTIIPITDCTPLGKGAVNCAVNEELTFLNASLGS
jgi:hypothetical protein